MARKIVFVLGMARSGTSALTKVLSLCGARLPAGMMGGFVGNPTGYWEPRKTIQINETILRRHGSTIHDPTLRMWEDTFSARERTVVRDYLHSLHGDVVVVKDLAVTVLADLWFGEARNAGLEPCAVIAVRHPGQACASLQQMALHPPPELAGALWLKHNLIAEHSTRPVSRVFVEYTKLLKDWRVEMKRISTTLNLDLDLVADVDEFLTADLCHQTDEHIPVLFGQDWTVRVWEMLSAAARDHPVDETGFDEVFGAYRAAEHDFRVAVGDWRKARKSAVPPWLGRVGLELAALAHRRRGTWA
jgi:hypothetical protein